MTLIVLTLSNKSFLNIDIAKKNSIILEGAPLVGRGTVGFHPAPRDGIVWLEVPTTDAGKGCRY